MNFLTLAQMVCQESGISETGPSTTKGQTGIYGLVVKWVNQSWIEIQNEYDWPWMRKTKEFTLVDGQQAYTPVGLNLTGVLKTWKLDTIKIYQTSIGVTTEKYLTPMDYDDLIKSYNIGSQPENRPISVAQKTDPDGDVLYFGPVPDQSYTAHGDYFERPSELSEDGDVPEMPERFHVLIVDKALIKYGRYDNAMEIYEISKENYRELFEDLWSQYGPKISLGKSPIS